MSTRRKRTYRPSRVDDVNIFVSHDVGWTAEQLAHMTVGIGLRLFPRVEPPKRWQPVERGAEPR